MDGFSIFQYSKTPLNQAHWKPEILLKSELVSNPSSIFRYFESYFSKAETSANQTECVGLEDLYCT